MPTTKNERRRPPRTGSAEAELGPTLVDEAESTPSGAQEMAAARLAVSVAAALRKALEASGLRQADLAERTGVTAGRVSQLLADGNLRVATIGRFARALGYQARLVLDPLEEGLPSISGGRAHRGHRRMYVPRSDLQWHNIRRVVQKSELSSRPLKVRSDVLLRSQSGGVVVAGIKGNVVRLGRRSGSYPTVATEA